MRRGHANLLCIVPILTDDPRRESIWTLARGGYTWWGKASCAQCAGSAGAGMSTMWRFFRKNAFPLPEGASYLLGLLAMIKCSICSYQCDNWYVSNRKLACHINFSWGCWFVSLLASTSRVALAWHFAKRGAPFGVPSIFFSYGASCVPGCRRIFSAPAIEHHFVSLFNIGKMK